MYIFTFMEFFQKLSVDFEGPLGDSCNFCLTLSVQLCLWVLVGLGVHLSSWEYLCVLGCVSNNLMRLIVPW